MNLHLIARLLGVIAFLVGASMAFSLPWAFPQIGYRAGDTYVGSHSFEWRGFLALLASMAVSMAIGAALWSWGRKATGKLFRREAMAVVGLSWILATGLGALPYLFGQVQRCNSVRLSGHGYPPLIYGFDRWQLHTQWIHAPHLSEREHEVFEALVAAGAIGLPPHEVDAALADGQGRQVLLAATKRNPIWNTVLIHPQSETGPPDRRGNFRFRWVPMGIADALFESQSGFSTTGATVLADLEDRVLVPHCILFWRSTTHFLGGLGIIVLFVSILGQGSAGKALMRAEMPGPTKEGATARMQDTAWLFAIVYLGLNIVLAVLLMGAGMTAFDASCHAFGAMATGGFSTYNSSVGHFAQHPQLYNSLMIETAIIVFMILPGTNFTLLYLFLVRQPRKLYGDTEWRAYMALIGLGSLLVIVFGRWHGDFPTLTKAIRYGVFQVVSIITTTGFGTHDFDTWNGFGRAVLFILMFVGGCAGSTGGGMKVIRHVLLFKILRQEIELSGHPRVVRPLRLGDQSITDPQLRKSILVYGCLIACIFVGSWAVLVAIEPDVTWGRTIDHKLIDCASGVAATLNNIGPGLGIVGASQQYSAFSPTSKLLFVWLMMLGRLELFSILVLFSPRFWRVM